jgi:chaperonin cofactor prefoldin
MTDQERITELEGKVNSLERQLSELQSELKDHNSKTIRSIREAIAAKERSARLAQYGL